VSSHWLPTINDGGVVGGGFNLLNLSATFGGGEPSRAAPPGAPGAPMPGVAPGCGSDGGLLKSGGPAKVSAQA
jgi:hypothetical protein